MACKVVTFKYENGTATPSIQVLPMSSGDSVVFTLAEGAPPNARIRVTFSDEKLFGRRILDDGDEVALIASGVPAGTRVPYECELVVDGAFQPGDLLQGGGEIEIGTTRVVSDAASIGN